MNYAPLLIPIDIHLLVMMRRLHQNWLFDQLPFFVGKNSA